MMRMIAVTSRSSRGSSSQYDRSCACQSKSVAEATPFFARTETTSRAWTSITTNAPSVLRCSDVSSPRTRSTIFSKSAVHFSSYALTAPLPSPMALVTSAVQFTAVHTSTTMPGQSRTH